MKRTLSAIVVFIFAWAAMSSFSQAESTGLYVAPKHLYPQTNVNGYAQLDFNKTEICRDDVKISRNGEELSNDGISFVIQKAVGLEQDVAIFSFTPTKPGRYRVSFKNRKTSFTVYSHEIPIEQLRKAARLRQRRIIYNNDGCDALYGPGRSKTDSLSGSHYPDVNQYLQTCTSGLADSQVDTISYCTVGGFSFWHNTKVGHFIDRGIARTMIERYGKDCLQIQSEFARQNGKEFFWSMRMSDNHDSIGVHGWFAPYWKIENPEYVVGKPGVKYPYGHSLWSGLNYDNPQVRQKVFDVIEEVVRGYDIDGVELDFYRGEPFFSEQLTGDEVTAEHCEKITGLLKRLRAMADEVGRRKGQPILLAVRVPDSLSYARAIGLDIKKWLEESLVDMVIGGGLHRFEPWENMDRLVNTFDLPFYACISGSYIEPAGENWVERWRGQAINAWQSGVEGIYTFNFFTSNHELFDQMGSMETLKGKIAYYEFEPGNWLDMLKDGESYVHQVKINPDGVPFDSPLSVKLAFAPDNSRTIHYTLDGSDPKVDSNRFDGKLILDDSTVLKAAVFRNDGSIDSPVAIAKFKKITKLYKSLGTSIPFNVFGKPNGYKHNVRFEIDTIIPGKQCYFDIIAWDIDDKNETTFFINGNGPIKSPRSIQSGSMKVRGRLDVPVEYLKEGLNEVDLIFDNLNGGTGGYGVAQMLLIFD